MIRSAILLFSLLLIWSSSYSQSFTTKIPKTDYSDHQIDVKATIAIEMLNNGKLKIDGEYLKLSALGERLIEKYNPYPDISKKHILCVLYADGNTPYKFVDELEEELKRLGLSKLIYAVMDRHASSVYSEVNGIKRTLDIYDEKAHRWYAEEKGMEAKKFESIFMKAYHQKRFISAPEVSYTKRAKLEGPGASEVYINADGSLVFNGKAVEGDFRKTIYQNAKRWERKASYAFYFDEKINYQTYIRTLAKILGGIYDCRNEQSLKLKGKEYQTLTRRERTAIKNKYPILLFDYSFVEKAFYKF